MWDTEGSLESRRHSEIVVLLMIVIVIVVIIFVTFAIVVLACGAVDMNRASQAGCR